MPSHPPAPKPAAVVILLRPDGQVYLVQRPKRSRFFPGFHAFPGGGVEEEDRSGDRLSTLRACAARELAEETTVQLDPADLAPAGVSITPPFSPIRYDTQFFLARVDQELTPVPQAPELAGGGWFDPEQALEGWRADQVRIPPPVIHVLEVLVEAGADGLLEKGTTPNRFPIAFASGLRVQPLEVSTLPPHTHTNAFLVGEEQMALVDPGAGGKALEPLLGSIEMLEQRGHEVTHVLLSHHHEDHVAGLQDVLDRFDPLLACSSETAERVAQVPDRLLEDGDVVELSGCRIEVIATPGHAPGHLAFHLPSSRALLPGDLVAGIGTVLIPPGEGDMAAYMASLERLAQLADEEGARLLFPSHGPPSFRPARKLRETLEHRRMREQRVLEAVGQHPGPLGPIAQAVYADKSEAPEALAELSTRAHLDKLVAEGRVQRQGETWRVP